MTARVFKSPHALKPPTTAENMYIVIKVDSGPNGFSRVNKIKTNPPAIIEYKGHWNNLSNLGSLYEYAITIPAKKFDACNTSTSPMWNKRNKERLKNVADVIKSICRCEKILDKKNSIGTQKT